MKLGFVVNPYAGIGGAVALKGSDGADIVAQAFLRGASPQAEARASVAMHKVKPHQDCVIYTAAGAMGENLLRELDIPCVVLYHAENTTSAQDTKKAVQLFVEKDVDLIVFAGGDGTARDVLDALSEIAGKEKNVSVPVVGIPAGVKIHSAVYAITPTQAGELIDLLLSGEAMTLVEAQVMDLDENAFRQGKVNAKCYGYLTVPVDDTRMQLIKQGGLNHEEIVLQDIATEVIETMEPDVFYLIGSGSTTAEIMNQLALQNTLLGVDIVYNHELVASDVDEQTILNTIKNAATKIVVTVIGGQGHIFGRGNQQLSASVIQRVINRDTVQTAINDTVKDDAVNRDNIIIVASNEKLRSLNKRPMIADTGNTRLDKRLSGLYAVITGYQQKTLYRLNSPVVG